MVKRVALGMGAVLLLAVAAMASMVRIVPADPLAESAAPTVATDPPALPTIAANPPQPPSASTAVQLTHPRLTVPVQGVPRSQIIDSWGQTRANGARLHQASDIMAPGGTPVIAAAPGTVEKLFNSQGGGGISLYVRSPDRLWTYYYAHLQGYAPGVTEGMTVRAGDLIGYVGDTGNSGAGNFHLHFGMSRMRPEERWHQGQPVNPYPLLAAGSGGG